MRSAQAVINKRIACDLPVPEKELLSSKEAAKQFTEILEKYSLHDWQTTIRPRMVADVTVGNGHIYIREDAKFAAMHIEALIAHEIETHILTAENGSHQPYAIFRSGCANYLDTQEGLAVYNQNRIYSPFHEKRYNPPRGVLGVAFALEHSFADTREYLQETLGYDAEKALNITISMKRGLVDTSYPGAFTKSVVYYRGLRAIEQYVKDGGDLTRLYVGKIALEDLELIEKIEGLEAPLILPSFLRE